MFYLSKTLDIFYDTFDSRNNFVLWLRFILILFLERRADFSSKLNNWDYDWELTIKLFNSSFSSASDVSNGSIYLYFFTSTASPFTIVLDLLDYNLSDDLLHDPNYLFGDKATENDGCNAFIFSGLSIWSFWSSSGIWSIFFRLILV